VTEKPVTGALLATPKGYLAMRAATRKSDEGNE